MYSIYHDVLSVVEASFLVVAALFPIVNPIGSAAVFLAMLGDAEPGVQKILSQKIGIYSFFLLFFSMLCGGKVLSFFGISLYAVQIGGGVILAASGWQLLNSSMQKTANTPQNPQDALNQAFYPFTLPITVGPGSISVAVALGAHLSAQFKYDVWVYPRVLIAAFAGSLTIAILVYVCYRWARQAEHFLGKTGTIVTMRLSSFILLCIGVQILASGVRAYVETFPHR
jgi:multiple antibiotic resistance protein